MACPPHLLNHFKTATLHCDGTPERDAPVSVGVVAGGEGGIQEYKVDFEVKGVCIEG